MNLTKERVRELLNYDPATGIFSWRIAKGNVKAGSTTGCPDRSGHLMIGVDSRLYMAHRLAWLYYYGDWPTDQIDHRNGVRDDNRITNLREASGSENQQNVSKRAGASSRFLGVTWHANAKKWQAKIQHRRKKLHLGYFETENAAHSAYLKAKAELHTFNPTLRAGAMRGKAA